MTSRLMALDAFSICWKSAVLPITRAASRNSLQRWRAWQGGGAAGAGWPSGARPAGRRCGMRRMRARSSARGRCCLRVLLVASANPSAWKVPKLRRPPARLVQAHHGAISTPQLDQLHSMSMAAFQ